MKTTELLKDLEEYYTLIKYLALGNTVHYDNGMTVMKLTMDENLETFASQEHTEKPIHWNEYLNPKNATEYIIPALKEIKPVNFTASFVSHWDEIKYIVSTTIALTKSKRLPK